MAKTLIILESPGKVKKVQQYAGPNYVVKASVGHIRDLPVPKNMTAQQKEKYGDYAIDVNSPSFEPLYKNSLDKAKVIKELKDALSKCSELILFTDSDMEGQAISWHLLEVLQPKVPTYRATTLEITQAGIDAALKSKKLIDLKARTPKDFFQEAEAALTRGSWDRMYGYASSPFVWKAIKPGTSSGRVQTPGSRLVVEREEKRLAFKSINFYTIIGNFGTTTGKLVEYKKQRIATGNDIDEGGKVLKNRLLITDDNVEDILADLQKKQYQIDDIVQKPYRRSAPPPFTTSSALQAIGGKTGMSAKQITSIFQHLYGSEGAITYIRTVSVVAAPEAIDAARKEILRVYGKPYLSATPNVFKDKKAENSGHECIRPVLDSSHNLFSKKFTDSKHQKVFDIIRLRMLASQGADCKGTIWTAVIRATDDNATFASSETEIVEAGWTQIYKPDGEAND